MKALRQLGFLKLSLRADGAPEEDHRVLALFRNRAELKIAEREIKRTQIGLLVRIKNKLTPEQQARLQEMRSRQPGR